MTSQRHEILRIHNVEHHNSISLGAFVRVDATCKCNGVTKRSNHFFSWDEWKGVRVNGSFEA